MRTSKILKHGVDPKAPPAPSGRVGRGSQTGWTPRSVEDTRLYQCNRRSNTKRCVNVYDQCWASQWRERLVATKRTRSLHSPAVQGYTLALSPSALAEGGCPTTLPQNARHSQGLRVMALEAKACFCLHCSPQDLFSGKPAGRIQRVGSACARSKMC